MHKTKVFFLFSVELAIARNAAEDQPVLLNIGGTQFEVTWSLLDKLPQSR